MPNHKLSDPSPFFDRAPLPPPIVQETGDPFENTCFSIVIVKFKNATSRWEARVCKTNSYVLVHN